MQTLGQFNEASQKYEQFVKNDLGISDEAIKKKATNTA